MGVLSQLEPKGVFHYFEQICSIPHGSGNLEQISDYLALFAEQRGLEYYQDELKNVIIIKEATPGYETEEPLILQGHMDMVAVKKPDCESNMLTDPLHLAVDGDMIYAEGTSLGGDDGIAVAYALAVLDSDTIVHPRLEVVFTADEEVGMEGATGISLSMLKGRRLLNLDSEEEGILLAGCAGGARVRCMLPVSRTVREGICCKIKIHGLLGGHSGAEIHKERGNANGLLGRLLSYAAKQLDFFIVSLNGGLADNAIPREAKAVLIIDPRDAEKFAGILDSFEAVIQAELASRDPRVCILAEKDEDGTGKAYQVLTKEDAERVISLICLQPDGVQGMSAEIPGLVETSLNLGMMKLEENTLLLTYAVRSSVESKKYELIDNMALLSRLVGATTAVSGEYPAWEYRKHSELRNKMVNIFSRMYGRLPEIQAIHAGLECGILSGKIADLDCVSFGPDMQDIHTTEEKLSVSSTGRVWEYLLAVLAARRGDGC